MSRRTKWTLVLTVLALAAFAVPAAASAGNTRTYEVTIYNLTDGQPFTPPLVATHRQPADLFEVGEPASEGIKEIAENGNLAPLMGALDANKHVSEVVVALSSPPPVLPGGSVTFSIDGGPGAKWLSFASMLICTNDGFTGLDSLRLPKRVGDEVSASSFAYDAGTEINTEQLADIVPPCQGFTAVGSEDVAGTGMSDPALLENGVITHHEGVMTDTGDGSETLLVSVNGWNTDLPVAAVTIMRTG